MAKQMTDEPLVAPYLAFKSFLAGITTLRTHGLPTKLDKSAWHSRSGGEQSAIWTAFKFLGFIDENGNPQDIVKKLVATKENSTEEKELLKGALQARYKKVFELDLNTATPMQMADAIGEYNVTGTTRDRAVLFFIKATEHVGIKISERLKKGFRTPPSRKPKKKNGDEVEGELDDPAADTQGQQIKTITLPNVGGTLTISGTFNALELEGDERELVFALVDTMKNFEKKTGKKGDSAG